MMYLSQEQLGYTVYSGVRRSNGTLGIGFIIQSDRSPGYLDTRIEHFIQMQGFTRLNRVLKMLEFGCFSTGENLAALENEEFSQHVEALAKNILEKPKRMSEIKGIYWGEITSKHVNFKRDEIEV